MIREKEEFLNKKEKEEGAQGKLPFFFLVTETEEGGPTATPGRRPLGHGGGHGGGENREESEKIRFPTAAWAR